RLLERLLAPDIIPSALDLVGLHRSAGVEPLDETSWLIRIVSRGNVSGEERQRLWCTIGKRDSSEVGFRFLRLFFEVRYPPVAIGLDLGIFFHRLEITHVISGERGGGTFRLGCELGERLAEEIVACHYDERIFRQFMTRDDEIDIADCS